MAAESREEKARILFSSQKYCEAAQEYARLAKDEPNCAKWLTNRAKCLFNLNKHEAAIKLCRKSMNIDKAWSRGYEIAGQCLLALQRNIDAEAVLADGMQAAPTPGIEKLLTDARMAVRRQEISTQYDRTPAMTIGDGVPGVPCDGLARDAYLRQRIARLSASDRALVQRAEAQRERVMKAAVLENLGRTEQALPIYEHEAEAGCTNAMSALARIYLQGAGVPSDPSRGLAWARRCVDHGPARDLALLGLPDLGLASSQEQLGSAYRHGLAGLTKDLQQAERYLHAAADAGDPLSMNNLASLLTQLGRPAEHSVALYRRAAELGYPRAMLNLGLHLKEGAGCARDFDEAGMWLDKAAAAGDLLAVKGLLALARLLATDEAAKTLDSARRHVGAAKARESKGGGGIQGSTLAMEVGVCFESQRANDRGLSQEQLVHELEAAGHAPQPFEAFLGGRPATGMLVGEYRALLVQQLSRHRKLTKLEREAAQLAEKAGNLALSSMSSGIACPNVDDISETLVMVGRLFLEKGMEAEAHARLLLPAAKLGDPQGSYLAGRHLAATGASAKDLRAAQKFLAHAAAREVRGAQDELDALTSRLARGDLGGASSSGSGGQNKSVKPARSPEEETAAAGFSAEDVRVAKELADAMNLLKGAEPNPDSGNPFIPGGLAVHLPILESYVGSHRWSYTGWSLLYSRRHFQNALVALMRGDYAAAATELCHAYLFDEKGVEVSHSVDRRTGAMVPAPGFLQLRDYADRELNKGPPPAPPSSKQARGDGTANSNDGDAGQNVSSSTSPFFRAAIVRLCMATTLPERIRCADLALKAAPRRLVPALRNWRGLLGVFQGDYTGALGDLEAAHTLLRDDASTSLWPYDPPELAQAVSPPPMSTSSPPLSPGSTGSASNGPATMARFREIMASTVDYNLGRLAVVLTQPAKGVSLIKRFQQGVPEDTHRLCESYSDLAEALMAQGPSVAGPEAALEGLQALLRESDRLEKLRVPVFRQLKPEDCPKLQQMKAMVAMLAHANKAYPGGMNGGVAGLGGNHAGPNIGGKGGAAGWWSAGGTVWGPGAGAAVKTCCGCGMKAESLRRCAGCHLVQYCSQGCQKKHWKAGHKEACAKMPK